MSISKELLNQAVFTTKYVMRDKSPIVYVSHDSDGDWQFFGPEQDVQAEEAMLVSLDEILAIDATIKEILELPINSEAHRDKIGGKWYIND